MIAGMALALALAGCAGRGTDPDAADADLGLFPGIRAGVASYSGSGVSLRAAAGMLTGRLHPAGQLPVAIPAAAGGTPFGYGAGLFF